MLLAASLSFCVAFAGLLVLLSAPVRRLALDHPNSRSLHVTPVPRTGGLAILTGATVSLAFVSGQDWSLMLIALTLAAVSFGDDLFGLPAAWRLAAHLAAAAFALWLIHPRPEALLIIPLLLGIGWITNLYNFMDGSDGLAGGMAIAGFGTFAIAAQMHGSNSLAVLCIAIASASFAFLLFNFQPAKIFMGDVGSGFLGIVIGGLSLIAANQDPELLWVCIILLAVFVSDATVTLIRRLLRKQKPHVAHRSHAYQHLAIRLNSHAKVALLVLAANIIWLLPIAFLVADKQLAGSTGVIIAYAPLLVAALALGAGKDSATN